MQELQAYATASPLGDGILSDHPHVVMCLWQKHAELVCVFVAYLIRLWDFIFKTLDELEVLSQHEGSSFLLDFSELNKAPYNNRLLGESAVGKDPALIVIQETG